MASPKLMVIFLALSVLVTVSAVPFWNDVVVTGAHVWVYSVPIVSVKIQVHAFSLVFFLMLHMWLEKCVIDQLETSKTVVRLIPDRTGREGVRKIEITRETHHDFTPLFLPPPPPLPLPQGSADWVISNQYLLEFTSGLVMTIIVLFLVVYRRPELRQVRSSLAM